MERRNGASVQEFVSGGVAGFVVTENETHTANPLPGGVLGNMREAASAEAGFGVSGGLASAAVRCVCGLSAAGELLEAFAGFVSSPGGGSSCCIRSHSSAIPFFCSDE